MQDGNNDLMWVDREGHTEMVQALAEVGHVCSSNSKTVSHHARHLAPFLLPFLSIGWVGSRAQGPGRSGVLGLWSYEGMCGGLLYMHIKWL